MDIEAWERHIDELSVQGLRVLAVAERPADGVESIELADLEPLTDIYRRTLENLNARAAA